MKVWDKAGRNNPGLSGSGFRLCGVMDVSIYVVQWNLLQLALANGQ